MYLDSRVGLHGPCFHWDTAWGHESEFAVRGEQDENSPDRPAGQRSSLGDGPPPLDMCAASGVHEMRAGDGRFRSEEPLKRHGPAVACGCL